jgi:hypothetical protein
LNAVEKCPHCESGDTEGSNGRKHCKPCSKPAEVFA